jgi:hypothetical protein
VQRNKDSHAPLRDAARRSAMRMLFHLTYRTYTRCTVRMSPCGGYFSARNYSSPRPMLGLIRKLTSATNTLAVSNSNMTVKGNPEPCS